MVFGLKSECLLPHLSINEAKRPEVGRGENRVKPAESNYFVNGMFPQSYITWNIPTCGIIRVIWCVYIYIYIWNTSLTKLDAPDLWELMCVDQAYR